MNNDTDTMVGKFTSLAKWITQQNLCSLSFSDYIPYATYHCFKFQDKSVSQNYKRSASLARRSFVYLLGFTIALVYCECDHDLICFIFHISLIATVGDKSCYVGCCYYNWALPRRRNPCRDTELETN